MIQLRPYQAEGLEAILNYFKSGKKGNPLLAWPTGTGKSIIPAIFIKDVLKQWPNQKFLLLTHVSELIKQNAEILQYVWPTAPLGIFSAGLKLKQSMFPIVYGGIQSMIKNPAIFGHRDLIFIDEAHLVSQDDSSQYITFLSTMRLLNPLVKVIGMSATPYRMGQGLITDGGLFTDIVHDLTGVDAFNKLIVDGYIAPLIPLRTRTELDVSNVGILKGEFIGSQLQSAVDKVEITHAGLRECVEAGKERKSWLLFASGIEHAEHIAEMLRSFGIDCAAVHSKQKAEYNDRAIKAFRNNELRSIVNYGKLTTGFNHPEIDLIGMFRPTLSVALWVQMLGRGTRPALNKKNCLVLDFAKNTIRLGPINDPIIPRKKGEEPGIAPVKICEACGMYNYAKVRFCGNCNAEFSFAIKITAKASTEELLRSDFPVIESFKVEFATYQPKVSGKNGQQYIRAGYYVGGRTFIENVFPEAKGWARKKFVDWWRQRHPIDPPLTTSEALNYIKELRTPKRIRVWLNKPYPEVMGSEY